jgi:hypothetical protein
MLKKDDEAPRDIAILKERASALKREAALRQEIDLLKERVATLENLLTVICVHCNKRAAIGHLHRCERSNGYSGGGHVIDYTGILE